ncbi:hypothetical protein CHUAL_005596 [Chamberlinius hualienensis]
MSIMLPLQSVNMYRYFGRGFKILPRLTFNVSNERGMTTEVSHPWPKTPEELMLLRKPRKIQRQPFVKNLFLGIYDENVLTYPEVLDRQQLATLEEMVIPVERFFLEEVDGYKIERDGAISQDIVNKLKELGLFGLQIPVEYGGLGLSSTEYARLTEVLALNGSIAVMLGGHQSIGLKGIIIDGTEKQKEKYLPKLATGEHIAAFCLTEPSSGSDAASIRTQATLSADGRVYHLNGSKLWITNGGIADIFTVFAKVKIGKDEETVTAFIVERAFGGVTNGPPEDKLGIRGSNTCEVHFDNTPVPVENILGQVGTGFKVAMNILNSGRFGVGSSVAGEMRHLLSMAAEHAIQREQFQKPIKDFELIQDKFVNVAMQIYVMESMAYLTAGLIDSQEKPDCAVEAAITKVYSSEAAWNCSSELLQVMGGQGYMKSLPFERVLRDSRILSIFEGTNEILRLFIALNGCQYAGKELAELVRKLRNPVFYPGLAFSTMWKRLRQKSNRPKLYMDLPGSVHPSFRVQADAIEYATRRLEFAVELALHQHGHKIMEKQWVLKRLADIAIDIYAMTACVGRASRSYCLGFPNCKQEVSLVRLFCDEAADRIERNFTPIAKGPFYSGDALRVDVAEHIFKHKGYFFSHPLRRT